MTMNREHGERAPGRRSALSPDGGRASARWRRLHRGVTTVIVGAASVAAVQLGMTGPALSPVQSATSQPASNTGTGDATAATDDTATGTQNQNQTQNQNGTGMRARGENGRGGNGGGNGGGGRGGR
jgi:hypothetical protein